MKPLFKSENIKIAITILTIMLFVKLVWFIVEIAFLDVKGVDYVKPSEAKTLYYNTRFVNQRHVIKPRSVKDNTSFELLAIYHSADRVVVTISKRGKTSILTRGDKIDGYVLDDATLTEAIFLRGGISYRIKLAKFDSQSGTSGTLQPIQDKTTSPKRTTAPVGEVVNADGLKVVDRTLIEHYSKNMRDIWKNIGINELKKDGQITGFKVSFVKRGSNFAKLGLRRGDVIKAINGQELRSYKRAFDIYKNIDTMDSLTLKILRGKEEMELEYEIN